MKSILVAGGCGFIGSHFIEHLWTCRSPAPQVINVDVLTYAANPSTVDRLNQLGANRSYRFLKLDIASESLSKDLSGISFDAIVNFAAETHVDRSILNPLPFIYSNIVGVERLLLLARERSVPFLQISTDEVYGSLTSDEDPVTEEGPLRPTSPYAASKASGDLLSLSHARTFDQTVLITRCGNNFGPYQHVEKLIPMTVIRALQNQTIPIYGSGKQIRDWILATDHCDGVLRVLENGKPGEIYHIASGYQKDNLTLVKAILDLLGKPHSLIEFVADRRGHDWRYALSPIKIQSELKWRPRESFDTALATTVQWYVDHPEWWKPLLGPSFQEFYKKNYGGPSDRSNSL